MQGLDNKTPSESWGIEIKGDKKQLRSVLQELIFEWKLRFMKS
jgi:hypothetical protein